jgi:glycosyltransferase involved in cell wall biosynthesis
VSRRPRILYVYYATYGTAGAYVATLVEAFRGLPVDATFAVSAYYRFPTDHLPPNVRVLRHFFRLTEGVPENRFAARLRGGPGRLGRLALRAAELWWNYLRLVVHIVQERVDVVNLALNDDYLPTYAFARAVRILRRRLFVTAHDVVAHDRDRIPRRRRWILSAAERIVVHGHHVVELLARKAGIASERTAVHVFPWCDVRPVLDPETLARARAGFGARVAGAGMVLLAPGYVRASKGIDLLAEAWLSGPAARGDLRLVVAGVAAPDTRAMLAGLSQGNNTVLEIRRLTDEELQAALEICDLVVLPYREYAHSSVHLNAYLSAARPVLASDIPLFRADVDPDTGLLVPPEDPSALAAGILAAASLGRDELRARGRAGRDRVLSRLSALPDQLRGLYAAK